MQLTMVFSQYSLVLSLLLHSLENVDTMLRVLLTRTNRYVCTFIWIRVLRPNMSIVQHGKIRYTGNKDVIQKCLYDLYLEHMFYTKHREDYNKFLISLLFPTKTLDFPMVDMVHSQLSL